MQGNPLAETDRPYRLLVEAVVDYAIYLIDLSGRIASWNPGARRLKGYEAEEVIGQPFSIFFTEEDRRLGRPEAALETARRHGRCEAEGWRVRKDGSRFWASVVIHAIRDDEGDDGGGRGALVGFAKVTRDITERREAQRAMDALREQMAQAQKLEALGQLTGGIAHNFSNLLQIVMSGVRLAQGLAGGDERLERILADIAEAAEQRAGLAKHLLAFARKLPTRPEAIDTAAHLGRAADLFGPSLRGDIQVDLDLADGPWPIR